MQLMSKRHSFTLQLPGKTVSNNSSLFIRFKHRRSWSIEYGEIHAGEGEAGGFTNAEVVYPDETFILLSFMRDRGDLWVEIIEPHV